MAKRKNKRKRETGEEEESADGNGLGIPEHLAADGSLMPKVSVRCALSILTVLAEDAIVNVCERNDSIGKEPMLIRSQIIISSSRLMLFSNEWTKRKAYSKDVGAAQSIMSVRNGLVHSLSRTFRISSERRARFDQQDRKTGRMGRYRMRFRRIGMRIGTPVSRDFDAW